MYALATKNNELVITRSPMSWQSTNGKALLFRARNEAMAALAYLSTPVVHPKLNRFTPRWKLETYLLNQIGFHGVLAAYDPVSMQAQLVANLNQRVEFFFEKYVVDFNPDLIRYFSPELFDITGRNMELRYLTPMKFSLTHTDALGQTTIVASYDLNPHDAEMLVNNRM